jgi:hypothetical protein
MGHHGLARPCLGCELGAAVANSFVCCWWGVRAPGVNDIVLVSGQSGWPDTPGWLHLAFPEPFLHKWQ